MSLLDPLNIKRLLKREDDLRPRKFRVGLTELQVIERVIKKGGRVAPDHADAYLAASLMVLM